jgi:hypothetical protein
MGTLASEFPPIQHGAIVSLRSVFLVKIDQVLPLPLFTSPRPFSNPISIWCYCPGYALARHMVLFETWLCFRHRGKSSMYTVAQLLSLGHSNCHWGTATVPYSYWWDLVGQRLAQVGLQCASMHRHLTNPSSLFLVVLPNLPTCVAMATNVFSSTSTGAKSQLQ